MLVLRTAAREVWRNLAIEEALVRESANLAQPLLFFWQSDHAVVVGKNQNPWREADIPAMRDEGCKLARRISGGGAVYHDLGNLNYTFVMDRGRYRGDRVFDVVVGALKDLGFDASRMGKTSIGANGRKVSGNAFCYRRGAALHHGTLLVSCDLDRMGRYLRAGESGIRTRAIHSQPAVTVNLREINPSLSMRDVEAALVRRAAVEWGGVSGERGDEWLGGLVTDEDVARMASWNWLYGHTPPFELAIEREVSGKYVRLSARVTDGVIEEAFVAVRDGSSGPLLFESRLRGVRFDADEIADRLLPVAGSVSSGLERALAECLLSG